MISAIFGLFFNPYASANSLNARVVQIIAGQTSSEESLILLSSGEVLRSTNQKIIQSIELFGNKQTLTFVESDNQVIFALPAQDQHNDSILDQYYDNDLPRFSPETLATDIRYTDLNFIPTNLKNFNDAQKLMTPLKLNEKSKSECFQRAHLWSIEMYKMAKINSQKVFLFFSVKYMREHRFNWWFHVAPFVLVNNEEYVLDQSFFDAPTDTQGWTNFFMPSHPICKTISNYRDYENHQEEQYCFLRKLPMYYYEPTEIENRDYSNLIISNWIDEQVSGAYASLNNAPWWKR